MTSIRLPKISQFSPQKFLDLRFAPHHQIDVRFNVFFLFLRFFFFVKCKIINDIYLFCSELMLLRHRRVCTWNAKRPTNGSLQVVTNVGYATDKLRNRFVLSVLRSIRGCYIALIFADVFVCASMCMRVSVSQFAVADGDGIRDRLFVWVEASIEQCLCEATATTRYMRASEKFTACASNNVHGRCCAQNRF